jgi:uncharacterized membrane protein YedE/YeeE
MKLVTAFACGLLFALGLGLGGMTDPSKVLGFLDVTGAWNPALMFVMGGALAVHIPLRWLVDKRRTPVPSDAGAKVDRRLLGGAAIFGLGWGLVGYCPGPAFTALATGSVAAVVVVASMLAGMALVALVDRGRSAPAADVGRTSPECG